MLFVYPHADASMQLGHACLSLVFPRIMSVPCTSMSISRGMIGVRQSHIFSVLAIVSGTYLTPNLFECRAEEGQGGKGSRIGSWELGVHRSTCSLVRRPTPTLYLHSCSFPAVAGFSSCSQPSVLFRCSLFHLNN